jgi:hypothetical protein
MGPFYVSESMTYPIFWWFQVPARKPMPEEEKRVKLSEEEKHTRDEERTMRETRRGEMCKVLDIKNGGEVRVFLSFNFCQVNLLLWNAQRYLVIMKFVFFLVIIL